VRKAE